jgi:hypothetical protein
MEGGDDDEVYKSYLLAACLNGLASYQTPTPRNSIIHAKRNETLPNSAPLDTTPTPASSPHPPPIMKVAIAQMTSKASPEHNFSVCEKMAKRAAKNGAEMVFWPESTDIIFDGDYPKEEERADYEGSRLKKFVDQMSGLAKEAR